MSKKKKVSFWSTKRISKPVRVSFTTLYGERVSFKSNRQISRPVKVTFYAKKKTK